MANNVWSSSGSTDYSSDANWSLSHVPKSGETAYFDSTSAVDCTLTANVTPAAVVMDASYTKTLAIGTYNFAVTGDCSFAGKVTIGVSADTGLSCVNYTLATGGVFTCSGASLITCSGNWDSSAGTFTRSTTNVVTLTGTSKTFATALSQMAYIVIAAGATISITTEFGGYGLTVYGTFTLSASIQSNGHNLVKTGGRITGTGEFQLYAGAIEEQNGIIDNSIIKLFQSASASTLCPGTYAAPVRFYAYSGTPTTTLAAGSYTFSALHIWAAGVPYAFTNSNNPNITVTGAVTFQESGGGALTYTKGTGTITLSGTAAQTINFLGKAVENVIVNKPTSGNITWTSGDTIIFGGDWSMVNLTVPAGVILDTKSGSNYALTLSGAFTQSSTTSKFLARASTITVNGNGAFAADGTLDQTQYNGATLVLNGTNTLTYSYAAYSTNGFYSLVCGQGGNTTTLASHTAIFSTLTIGSGTLSGATKVLYLRGSNPLIFDIASNLTLQSLNFRVSSSIPTLVSGYSCHIVVEGDSTVSQTGDVVLNTGYNFTVGQHAVYIATWQTNGYDLAANSFTIGNGSDTSLKKLDATHNGARTSTITVGGTWLNYGQGTVPSQFVADNSTVIFNSTASGKTITSGATNSPFNNITFNGVGGVWTAQDATTVTGNFTASAGTFAIGTQNLTVTGNSTVTGGTVTIGISGSTGWTTTGMTIGAGGVVTCTGASKINCGGNWESSAGTFTAGVALTSLVTLSGMSNSLKTANPAHLNKLTIADNASYTIPSNQPGIINLNGLLTVNGALIVNYESVHWHGLYVGGGLTLGSNGSVSGTGVVKLAYAYSYALTLPDPSALAPAYLIINSRWFRLPVGTYSPTTSLVIEGAGTGHLWSAGTYTFTSPVTFQNITVSTPLDVNTAEGNPNLIFQDNVTVSQTAGGAVTWTKGTGTITLSGTSDQTISLLSTTVEDIIIDKPTAGTVTLTATDTLTAGGPWKVNSLVHNGANIVNPGYLCPWPYPADVRRPAALPQLRASL